MSQATRSRSKITSPPTNVRAGIYTRKSTTAGLDSDFSSLDAQREACESYIRSLGWSLVPKEYNDGGFSGKNTDRPGFQRLRQDIEAGELDAVVVHRLDRLSRSVVDLHQTVEFFESHNVAFVSVTQRIDTSGSAGKLLLNMLAAVAEFERDMIADRTRDKIRAARRHGKWTGGVLVLGYQIDKSKKGLSIHAEEAELVRKVFDMYLRKRSIRSVADELNALGYRQKRFTTFSGKARGGNSWDKCTVLRLLRNPLYSGQIREGATLHAAEHPAIVSVEIFDRVQSLLDERSTGRGPRTSRKGEYLLTGLLRCGPCDSALTSSLSKGPTGTRYRYYRCHKENRHGTECPTGLLPALPLEQAVVTEVRKIAARGEIQRRITENIAQNETQGAMVDERKRYEAERLRLKADARRLLDLVSGGGPGATMVSNRLGEIETAISTVEGRIAEIEGQLRALDAARHDAGWVAKVLGAFDEIWEALLPLERRELLHLVVKRVTVDPARGKLHIAFYDFEDALVDAAGAGTPRRA